jgi:hypothetical protein
MPHTIDLYNDRSPDLTLSKILAGIEPFGKDLSWSIFHLWATGDLGDGKSILELEKLISSSPRGYFVTWEGLSELANHFDQVIDGQFIGCKDTNKIKRYEKDYDLYAFCDIVIEAKDSTVWRIHAKDPLVIEKFRTL